MTAPSSVLMVAERGSRFIEPMKMRFLSITDDLRVQPAERGAEQEHALVLLERATG